MGEYARAMLVGADGCPGGWFAAILDPRTGAVTTRILGTDALLALDAEVLAIDMPIGLTENGPRACDLAARRLISPRGSCLFASPVRGVLEMGEYRAAHERSRELCGTGLSKQSFFILPKIRELDRALRALPSERRDRVYETHPEVAFSAMSGRATLARSKHTPEGIALRREVLGHEFDPADIDVALGSYKRRKATKDDVLDAFACLWTAARIAGGGHSFVTPDEPRDAFGLRMTIAY